MLGWKHWWTLVVEGFWGFVPRSSPTSIFGLREEAEPGRFGSALLSWCQETDLALVEPTAAKVKAVRPGGHVRQDAVKAFPFLNSMQGRTWGQALVQHDGDIARTLLHGVGLQPTLVVPQWGYLVNFRERTLDVYSPPPLLALGDDLHLLYGLRLLVQFYLDHLPDRDVFLESIAEELTV